MVSLTQMERKKKKIYVKFSNIVQILISSPASSIKTNSVILLAFFMLFALRFGLLSCSIHFIEIDRAGE